MSSHHVCFACNKVIEVDKETLICPSCKSESGRMMADEEFKKQSSSGVIKLIDPSTGKPMK